jgi:predicted GNAT family N-acyltransferase
MGGSNSAEQQNAPSLVHLTRDPRSQSALREIYSNNGAFSSLPEAYFQNGIEDVKLIKMSNGLAYNSKEYPSCS